MVTEPPEISSFGNDRPSIDRPDSGYATKALITGALVKEVRAGPAHTSAMSI